MDRIKDRAAIVGIGYTPQGKVPGRTSLSFHLEAARNAIADAGLNIKEVDGLLIQPTKADPSVTAVGIAQHLGLNTRFLAIHDAYGASAACQAQHAAWALVNGMANYVLCTYGENARSGVSEYGSALNGGQEYGMFGAASVYALAARRGMHAWGTGPETWAEIAVGQRRWANLNPRAMMQAKHMDRDAYFDCRYIIEPFRLFDICLVSDGGRAFIVTTAERAKDLRKPPVYIMGMGQDHPAVNTPQADYLSGPSGAKRSGDTAFRMAGITKDDVDACELYDCFTYTVELELIDYGFFNPGEGKAFLHADRIAPGGDFPLNTSGGLLSEAYLQGFSPLTEAVLQLRGEAGARQLGVLAKTKMPEIILVSNNGGALQTHSTLIVRR